LSTILKALKQVDQTAPPDDIQSWPPEVDTKKTVKTRVESIQPKRKVYLAIALVVIIAAAGLFVYNQKDLLLARLSPGRVLEKDKLRSSASSKKGPVHHAQIKPSASKQTARSAKTDPPPTMGNQPAGLKQEPKQTGTDKQLRQLPKIPVRKNIIKPLDDMTSGQSQPLPKAVKPKSRISRSQTSNPKQPVRSQAGDPARSSAKKANSAVKPASQTYRRLDDPKLKLQAIAWSANAAQRIAVINNHVVREGESVEGFSVNQIRQDDIIVNDGTESWRLDFGLK
jgi:hypothetical protein